MNTIVNEKPLTREFMEKASQVSARVYPVKDLASAFSLTLELCRAKAPREELMHPLPAQGTRAEEASTAGKSSWIMGAPNLDEKEFSDLAKACAKAGDVLLIRDGLRAYPGGIDMGVTRMDFGIAETGTLVLNSNSEETRLSTMLCEIHVAILNAGQIRPTALSMAEELTALVSQPSSFTAFITGASRTADIERVLALGVHGPLEMVIILVEA